MRVRTTGDKGLEAGKGKRLTFRTPRVSSYIRPDIRLTPPRRASLRIAGLVIPWMLSRKILRWPV
jgi:hypothetical protein